MSQGITTAGNIQDMNVYPNYYTYTYDNDKRKIQEACNHCQKARLPCDGARPCQGCIKHELATSCSDSIRKKIKTNELFTPNGQFTPIDSSMGNTNYIDASQLFNFTLNDIGFTAETTGLEYGIVGNRVDVPTKSPITHPVNRTDPSYQALSGLFSFPSTPTTPQQPLPPQPSPHTHLYSPSSQTPQKGDSIASTPSSSASTVYTRRKGNNGSTPEAVYNSIHQPFNYAEGYHYLIQYVTDKMGKEDLMRISKALSLFRPSFLSLIMNLTEEDLVFMERCIQRTLLEYEKLISFSGTPTIVWRRTGEICLVGKEFSLLTQWSRDTLLNKKTYIFELMDNQSAVEYWEKFATHAFDNTDKTCNYSCILRTPQQRPVPCTFCFTIKRDIFDLPSVIIGNFLPILS
ncbi:hypothetical protein BDB01DRAFT_792195 [Pilobolus umbonatus]|nr:hypothetical protein BDB01DRAFT_792195 [Pilobolus umbonatus]